MSFVSFLKHIGHDFKRALDFVLPWAATAGEAAVSIFAPGLGPLFNQTVAAVVTAEQSMTALGKQSGTGTQKLSMVLQLMEPLIAQTLKDMGKDGSTAEVTNYINSVVTILNAAPAPGQSPQAPLA